jgi:transcriptional regulator with XRE-family HTH domain
METLKKVSPADFFKDMFETPAEQQALAEFMNRRTIVTGLAAVRVAKGITQAELAQVAGCTQGAISKLESGPDSAVTLAHLEAYAKATGSEMTILFSDRGESLADQIKHHVFCIRSAFERLVKLAHQDDSIARGVAEFHVEALLNVNQLLAQTAQKLPSESTTGLPRIRLAVEVLDEERVAAKAAKRAVKRRQTKSRGRRVNSKRDPAPG